MRNILLLLVWLILASCNKESPQSDTIYRFYSNRAVERLISSRAILDVYGEKTENGFLVSVINPIEEAYHFQGGYKFEIIGDDFIIFLHGMAVRPKDTINSIRYYEFY